MTTPNTCGDTCGLIDLTMALAGDRLFPEERMKLAIEAFTSGKMSQRSAADKYGVAQQTLSHRLAKVTNVGHSTKSQSQPEVSAGQQGASSGQKLTKEKIRTALRQLCKQQGGAPTGFSQSLPLMRGWLKWCGIAVSPELDGKTVQFNPSFESQPTESHGTQQQGLPANGRVAVVTDWATQADPGGDPIYDEDLDIDAVRDHVCAEVQLSERPADFKRAIALLRELDEICTDAWYRRHPEPWNHHDWAHVNSEIKAVQSLVRQRAEETADQLLFPGSAVTVKSAAVS